MFAKMFYTSLWQVVAIKQSNLDNYPEIRFYAEPAGLGVCSMALSYEEDDWEACDDGFDTVDFEMAEAAAKELNKFSGI